jgi:hypothetical protein
LIALSLSSGYGRGELVRIITVENSGFLLIVEAQGCLRVTNQNAFTVEHNSDASFLLAYKGHQVKRTVRGVLYYNFHCLVLPRGWRQSELRLMETASNVNENT